MVHFSFTSHSPWLHNRQQYSDKKVIPLVIINPQPAGDLLMMLTISYFASHISDKEGTTNSKCPLLHTVTQARTAGNQGTIHCICFCFWKLCWSTRTAHIATCCHQTWGKSRNQRGKHRMVSLPEFLSDFWIKIYSKRLQHHHLPSDGWASSKIHFI